MAITALITGFGPFPGAPVNPTAALATLLAARRGRLPEEKRIAHVFRTSYAAVDKELPRLLERHRPDVVLLFGLAARTSFLRVETRAVNSRSLLAADTDGSRPGWTAIDRSGPHSLHSAAPHGRLVAVARATGVAAHPSNDAGRYLCNFSYWRALRAAGPGGPLVQFVHVPMIRREPAPRWRADRRPSLDELVQAGEAVLAALIAAARSRRPAESGLARKLASVRSR